MAAPQPDTVASIKNGWACSPYGEAEMVEVLEVKHAPILTGRQKLVMECSGALANRFATALSWLRHRTPSGFAASRFNRLLQE